MKIKVLLIAGFLVLSAVSLDVSAAKKAGKLSKEEVLSEIEEVLDDIRSYMDIGEGRVEVTETGDIDGRYDCRGSVGRGDR